LSEHLSAQTIEQYHTRKLPPKDLLSADDHLATCSACRQRANEAVSGEKAFASLRADLHAAALEEPDHLSDEQLTALVDDDLDAIDREIVESHLEICASCKAEAADLRAFREEIANSPGPSRVPQTTPARPERFAFLRAWSLNRTALQFAAMTVVLLFVATAALLLWKATRSPNEEVALVRPTPAASPVASVEASPLASPSPPDNTVSQVALTLNDGDGRVTLDVLGNIVGLETLPPATQRAVRAALTTKRAEIPSGLKELAGKSGTLMGGRDEGVAFPLVSPVGVILSTDRPTLRWRPLNGATSYTVTIFDASFNVVVTGQPAQTNTWTVPRRLERGRVYSWQVAAVKDGKEVISPTVPAPAAHFKILDRQKAAELERLEATHTNSHLARGALYAQAGLLDDAEREFRALLKQNPQSPVAKDLLRSVRAARRQK
jgi:anti-sigma factor RsiW